MTYCSCGVMPDSPGVDGVRGVMGAEIAAEAGEKRPPTAGGRPVVVVPELVLGAGDGTE